MQRVVHLICKKVKVHKSKHKTARSIGTFHSACMSESAFQNVYVFPALVSQVVEWDEEDPYKTITLIRIRLAYALLGDCGVRATPGTVS
eukprot:9475532-Pyramimonas_sp.AAC.1